MGKVQIQVSLTNAADDTLVRRGLLNAEEVRSEELEALVDTGAVNCVLPTAVADRLGLERTFQQTRFLGPTGNLCAPCVRAGETTLVGFNEDAWSEVLART